MRFHHLESDSISPGLVNLERATKFERATPTWFPVSMFFLSGVIGAVSRTPERKTTLGVADAV